MIVARITALSLSLVICAFQVDGELRHFPDGFSFGVATASYQIEGGWNASDKSENIWDTFTHNSKYKILDGSSGDVACDSYHLYKRDVEMVAELGVDFYRFSLSWSRLMPDGYELSKDGVKYYNDLIDELLKHNIQPVVTLFHWDLPQWLQKLGGWSNSLAIKHFQRYARSAFELFGDRVKMWLTVNEPQVFCLHGYGKGLKAPGLDMQGFAEYLCGHTMLRAHAKVYHMYDQVFKKKQKGRVGLTLNASWQQAASNSSHDKEAAQRVLEFELGWFANPIFSKCGDYPKIMKDRILWKSQEQGYTESRLPIFTKEEIEEIKGSYDFFGLNHYTTRMVKEKINKSVSSKPSYSNDMEVDDFFEADWKESASVWLRVVPWGFQKLLNWIKDSYDNPEVIIFENGFSDRGGLDDVDRIQYYHDYLNYLLDAIDDGCNISAYTAWSLMDNFEWNKGYSERFGIYYVDYNSTTKKRTPKASAHYFKNIVKTKSVEGI